MYTEMAYLKEIIEKDIKQNGEQPLTNVRLLELINISYDMAEAHQESMEASIIDTY